LKICIDIQPAIAQRAGVGHYTRSLVEHLGAFRENDTVRLFYFDFQRRGVSFSTPGMEHKAVHWCPGRLAQQCWKRLQRPPFDWLAGQADVYHFPNFIIPPLAAGRTIVTIHDVSFLRYPEFAESRNLAWLSTRISDTVQRANAIITDSRFSAQEIIEHLSAQPEKVFPIHLGISNRLSPPDADHVELFRRKMSLDRPYLLTVGTLEPRKNLEFLITVFEHMTGFDGRLVLAGMRGWKYESILNRMKNSTRAGDIQYLEYVSDEDLPFLYGGAELFLFPSIYEGFGLPPLEAMSCGTAVIASSAGPLPEVLGDGALLIHDFDAERWASEAMNIISDTSLKKTWIDKGHRQAAHYTWQETARKTWEIYRQAAT